MRKVKKIVSLVLIISSVMMSVPVSADVGNKKDINTLYEETYENCLNTQYDEIQDDHSAYAYLLKNMDKVLSTSPLRISDELYLRLTPQEVLVLQDFVNRVCELEQLDAVKVNEDLSLNMPEYETKFRPKSRALIINIMPETRAHAQKLQEIKNRNVLGGGYITAVQYFYDRVKTGGEWDYKRYLGTKTLYHDSELGANITGETIGNFHYGYVGSVLFAPVVLKTAAGVVQVISGTSNIRFLNSYFDDPRDQKDIDWGIRKYNQEH